MSTIKRSANALVSAIEKGNCTFKYYSDDEALYLQNMVDRSEKTIYEYNPMMPIEDDEIPMLDLITYAKDKLENNAALLFAYRLLNMENPQAFHIHFHTKDIWFCTYIIESGEMCIITYLDK